jgi:superfamily II DNA or RNA helicase
MKLKLNNQIEITDLNRVDQERIESALTFRNPKFLEALKQGRSIRNIDRLIKLFQRTETGLTIPMGCLALVKDEAGEIDDQRNDHPVAIAFNGQLRPYQQRLIIDAIEHQGGVLVAPTGAGKTVSGIALAALLAQRCLILVKSGDLALQWIESIKQFTGLTAGLIGSGKNTEGEQFTVGLVQSLVKRDLSTLDYGLVIGDECHNAPASQFYTVINGLNARYKYGLSATPQRRDCLEFMIHAALGEVVAEIEQSQLENKVLPVAVLTVRHRFDGYAESWGDFVNTLIDDEDRNDLIISLAWEQTRPTIILCSQIRHCELLATMAQQVKLEPLLIHGQLPAKVRTERMAAAQNAQLIIGTSQLLGEGIDLPHLENLIFAAPMSAVIEKEGDPAATKLIQSIGRCRRPFPGKTHAFVFDIIDVCGFGIAAYKKRNQIYQRQGWQVQAAA